MAKINQNIDLYQGETKKLVFTVVDDSGVVVDLTGCAATWVLAKAVDSDDIILTKSTTLGTIVIVGNTFELVLSKSDTVDLLGNYYHEIRMIKVDLSEAVVATGNLIVKKSITK